MDSLIDIQLPADAPAHMFMDTFYNKFSITLKGNNMDYSNLSLTYLPNPLSIEPFNTLFRRVRECEPLQELEDTDKISALHTCTSEEVQFFVRVKPRYLKLNCIVSGHGMDSFFEVQLKYDASLYALKYQTATHPQLEAPDFKLFRISVPEQDYKSNSNLRGEELVNVTDQLSTIFTDCPPNHIHIVVNYLRKQEAPSTGGQPKNFAATQEQKEYRCNRPRNAAYPIPVTLFERIFADFVDDCQGYQPTAEDNRFVLKLSKAMCKFYGDDAQRMEECRELLAAYGVSLMAAKVGPTNFSTDGHVTNEINKYVCVILEGKNEVGSGGIEPFLEAMCYYRQLTRNIGGGPGLNSRFPCFLLTVFGPYIAIFRCVFREHVHADVLVPVIPLCWHATDYPMQEMAARIFGSFKTAVQKLSHHYTRAIPRLSTTPTTVTCPHPSTYIDFDGDLQRFTYEVAQPESNRLVFYANTERGRRVCIKFTKRYSSEVHRLCATNGHAPACIACQELPGGWKMVVMDVLNIHNYSTAAPTSYYRPLSYYLPLTFDLKNAITTFVRALHNKGFVHGDLRDVNVFVRDDDDTGTSTDFQLLDFDWVGCVGEVRYPINLNRTDIRRPDGAQDGAEITTEHDLQMLEYIFEPFESSVDDVAQLLGDTNMEDP
ncbi:hypothetical protein AX16_009832 [Volvariella volvacea WC 439]|nr:hypothetical protein AX16_009832 [Volvariella volvacea WC 439]